VRFDAVFFDSGGTLFGYRPPPTDGTPSFEAVRDGRARRTAALLTAIGHPCDEAVVTAALDRVAADLGPGFTWSSVDLITGLCGALGLPVRHEEILCVTEAYEGPRYRAWLFPGTVEALSALSRAGLPMGLIANTNVPGTVFDRMLHGVGLLEYLRVRVYSCEEGVEKPAPEIFHRAAGRLGVAGRRILYVGNSLEADVAGARGVGWSAALRLAADAPTRAGLADLEFTDWPPLVEWVLQPAC